MERKAAKPCFRRLEGQTKNREALCSKIEPPGKKISHNMDRVALDDEAPSDEELGRVTKRGENNKSGGDSSMRVEDLKNWSVGTERERRGMRGRGTCVVYSSAWSSTSGIRERSRARCCANLLC